MAQSSLENREYSDIDLNFTAHPVTKDVVKRTGSSAIIGALRNLLYTNFYEKPFNPNYGSGIRRLLFEDVSFVTASILEKEIVLAVKNFEPRITIDAIRVQANPEDNGYNITIRFYTNNLEAPITINMFLEKVR